MEYKITYDKENDILCILSSDLDYYAEEITDDYIEIRNSKTNKLLGYTILNYKQKHKKDIKDMPFTETNYEKQIKPILLKENI